MIRKLIVCLAVVHPLIWAQSSADGTPGRFSVATLHYSEDAGIRPLELAPSLTPPVLPVVRSTVDNRSPGARMLWIGSIAALAAANVLDAQSSWRKGESNQLLAGPQGSFAARGVAIKSGINTLWLISQIAAFRKNPGYRKLAVLNFVAASVFAAAACHNYRVSTADPGR